MQIGASGVMGLEDEIMVSESVACIVATLTGQTEDDRAMPDLPNSDRPVIVLFNDYRVSDESGKKKATLVQVMFFSGDFIDSSGNNEFKYHYRLEGKEIERTHRGLLLEVPPKGILPNRFALLVAYRTIIALCGSGLLSGMPKIRNGRPGCVINDEPGATQHGRNKGKFRFFVKFHPRES